MFCLENLENDHHSFLKAHIFSFKTTANMNFNYAGDEKGGRTQHGIKEKMES